MIRVIMWFAFWLLTWGFLSIDVIYKDGLHIKFHGWAERRRRKLK